MEKELIGCIADDFTGASDVCSFLVESGSNCIIVNDITDNDFTINKDVDVVVVALKIRSIETDLAIKKVNKVTQWFEKIGVTRVYSKYCSTFDSTEKGNIGPILDYLMQKYNQNYTLVAPALPANRREVFNGYLFADGVLLNEGSMRRHPLTPMKDSYIPRLLEPQSKYKCYTLNHRLLSSDSEYIRNYINTLTEDKHFYVVPDYINDEHGKKLAETFGELKLLSGGSALINEWYKYLFPNRTLKPELYFSKDKSPALILSGSLSDQTTKQVKYFIEKGYDFYEINSEIIKKENRDEVYKLLNNLSKPTLFYSSRNENFKGDYEIAEEIESFFSDLAKYAIEIGINKVVVAGGETSGSVIKKLGYHAFRAEKNVAPGVPILRPIESQNKQIILKSGNFGMDDFFETAINLMEG